MRFDVVIVGAGIGGAVLALDLGGRGWRVALLERESAPLAIARPEVLWGATPRALDRYGIGDALRGSASVQLEAIEIGGEKAWLRITRDDFAGAGVVAFSTNPSMTRAIVTDAAVATGNVEIQRGVAVESLLHDAGRVAGVRARRGEEVLEIEASVVVGDDGGGSVVRRSLGIPIELVSFPIEFVTATIRRWPLLPHRARVWIQPNSSVDGIPAAGLIPWPGNEGVLLVPLAAERAERFFQQPAEDFWSALGRVTPMAEALREQLGFPRDFKHVTRPFGHVASYVADGAALIGDAAHPMTPAGGQGANASIWDALALADVLDAALQAKDVSRERLLPYEGLRRPVNDRSVSISRLARRAFRVGGFLPLGFVAPAVAKTIDGLGWPKRRIIGSFANAFVHTTT
jgi:2-polyprenyl-6-methoxyphenol hydroxylase-like FAD-dependent oxidoreductase